MNPRNIAIPTFVLAACVLTCACTTLDKFTVRNMDNGYGQPASLEEQPLVLEEPCKYVAGTDINGKLSTGPLQPTAIGIPAPSNSNTRENIYLIQIGDLHVPGEQGGYDVASFIGVRKDGTLVHNLLLHSDRRVQARLRMKVPGSDSRRKIVTTRYNRPSEPAWLFPVAARA
jgi:hypothetical protein